MSIIESELKLTVLDPDCIDNLLGCETLKALSKHPPEIQLLDTTYYDTRELSLLKSHLSYRLRLQAGQWTATVKADGSSDGGLHQRLEYNLPAVSPEPNIEPFSDTAIGPRLLAAVDGLPLEPVFSTKFERSILNIIMPDGSEIELAIDNGLIIAGDRQQPLLELELELKSGNNLALLELGAALASEFPLIPEQRSKLYRASLLAGITENLGGDNPIASPLTSESTQEPASIMISKTIVFAIHQMITAIDAFLAEPLAGEGLQELTKALHRLLTLFEFARPLLSAEDYDYLAGRLQTMNKTLTSVRELELLLLAWQEIDESHTSFLGNALPKPALTSLIVEKHRIAQSTLQDTFRSGQSTPLLLGLWAYIEKWGQEYPLQSQENLEHFSTGRLSAWIKSFTKQGNKLDLCNLAAISDLEQTSRELQISLELLSPALSYRGRSFPKRLKKLQELLGELRAIAITAACLNDLIKASSSRLAHRDHGLLLGWQLSRSLAAASKWEELWSKTKKAAVKFKIGK